MGDDCKRNLCYPADMDILRETIDAAKEIADKRYHPALDLIAMQMARRPPRCSIEGCHEKELMEFRITAIIYLICFTSKR